MKRIFSIILWAILGVCVWSCQDEIDVDNALNFPPSILSNPTSVVIGNFDVKVVFADGQKSPLKSGYLILQDKDGNEIFKSEKALSGTKDSIVVEGSTFNAQDLVAGDYTLVVNAMDTDGKALDKVLPFKILETKYPANNKEMYIAGEFNNWQWNALELVSANTWEIKEVDLKGLKWKLKNTKDWTDKNYGDDDCDGFMSTSSDNTVCSYDGLVNIQFNDQTLKYTVAPSVTLDKKINSLFLLGSFNQFQGSEFKFTLTDNDIWELKEVRLKKGDSFKFSEYSNFSGQNFGDDNLDGKAELFSKNNITMPENTVDGFYKIVFNDKKLTYTLTFLRAPYPNQILLVGNATLAGWDNNSSIAMFRDPTNGFKFSYTGKFFAGELKFLGTRGQWQPQWGKGSADNILGYNSGTGSDPGTIVIDNDGYYTVSINTQEETYSVTPYDESSATVYPTIGIIGTSTPNGWVGPDVNLTQEINDPHQWFIDGQALTIGEMKFRANDAWDVSWGSPNFPYGKATTGNIPVSISGNFLIRFCDLTGEYAIIQK